MRYRYCNICGKRYLASTKCCTPKKIYDKKTRVYHTTTWRNIRKDKLQKQPYCIRCFNKFGYLRADELEMHHILSLNHYPEYKLEKGNLVIICRTCNLELSDKDKIDFDLPDENKEFIKNLKK